MYKYVLSCIFTHIYVCTHTHTHTYTQTYIYARVHTHTHTRARIYIYVCVCVCGNEASKNIIFDNVCLMQSCKRSIERYHLFLANSPVLHNTNTNTFMFLSSFHSEIFLFLFFLSCSRGNTFVLLHYMSFNETPGEKSWWKLHKYFVCFFEYVLEAAFHKTAVIWPHTSYLTNNPCRTSRRMLGK